MISFDQGKQLADSWSAAFIEASAKQNEVGSNGLICSVIVWGIPEDVTSTKEDKHIDLILSQKLAFLKIEQDDEFLSFFPLSFSKKVIFVCNLHKILCKNSCIFFIL